MKGRSNVTGLERVVAALRAVRRKRDLGEVFQEADLLLEELLPYATWNEKHYTRNPVVRTSDFELMLICFGPGQATSIHDYDVAEAWVRPIAGVLTEERFTVSSEQVLRRTRSRPITPGTVSHLRPRHSIHRYFNATTERAITLNLYAAPLKKWRIYDERSGASASRALRGTDRERSPR
ncbi:MAG: cysteine dioxygenase family protein [Flavobacteriales bacterium]|nr:cysteine dioxygenase family protein [Flavobacteriales bacterium]MCB9194170.1 cysteine dioxygenase family protein [Flavobacteriales bacterium]